MLPPHLIGKLHYITFFEFGFNTTFNIWLPFGLLNIQFNSIWLSIFVCTKNTCWFPPNSCELRTSCTLCWHLLIILFSAVSDDDQTMPLCVMEYRGGAGPPSHILFLLSLNSRFVMLSPQDREWVVKSLN